MSERPPDEQPTPNSDAPAWPQEGEIESYETIEASPEVELKVKASRFLGVALPAPDVPSAQAALLGVRKKHHDARHHGSAWRVGDPAQPLTHEDDDGEPSRTTGPPILAAIEREQLLGLVVVVTRWFGGVKLGTGGLIRAYGEAASEALAVAPRVRVWRDFRFAVEVDYADVGAVEATLAQRSEGLVEVERAFGERPHFRLRCRRSRARALGEALFEATAGRARLLA